MDRSASESTLWSSASVAGAAGGGSIMAAPPTGVTDSLASHTSGSYARNLRRLGFFDDSPLLFRARSGSPAAIAAQCRRYSASVAAYGPSMRTYRASPAQLVPTIAAPGVLMRSARTASMSRSSRCSSMS